MIQRALQNRIEKRLFKGKIILLTGSRQVGKTTLVKALVEKTKMRHLWWNGDEPDIREILSGATSTQLKTLVGSHQLVVIDEAQRISNIGLTLKLLIDNFKDVQVIATGSSSLDLANQINEPLTGRKYEFNLFPLSFIELAAHTDELQENRLVEHRLIYGYYPDIVTNPGQEVEFLSLLSESYLYKDVFNLEKIRKPALLQKLLQAIALQIGSQVSFNELAQLTGADVGTVERYIDLLEKTFVLFRLGSLSRNLRNELKKTRKIYFWDTGVRNAIIRNFNPLNLRQDTGALWENFLISERLKSNHYAGKFVNSWFWRTRSQQEIDYVEEFGGSLHAFEFKWRPGKKVRFPKSFSEAYPQSEQKVIDRKNFIQFL